MQIKAEIAATTLEQIARGGMRAARYPEPWREPPQNGEGEEDWRARRNRELGRYLDALARSESEDAGNLAACLCAEFWFRMAGHDVNAAIVHDHVCTQWRAIRVDSDVNVSDVAMRLVRRNDLRPRRNAYPEAA